MRKTRAEVWTTLGGVLTAGSAGNIHLKYPNYEAPLCWLIEIEMNKENMLKKKQEVNLQFLHHDDWPVARYWDIDNQLYSGARAGLELMMTNYFTMLSLIELWANLTVRRGAVELSLVFGFDVLLQGCGLSKCFIAVRTLMRFQTLMDSLDVSPEVTS